MINLVWLQKNTVMTFKNLIPTISFFSHYSWSPSLRKDNSLFNNKLLKKALSRIVAQEGSI